MYNVFVVATVDAYGGVNEFKVFKHKHKAESYKMKLLQDYRDADDFDVQVIKHNIDEDKSLVYVVSTEESYGGSQLAVFPSIFDANKYHNDLVLSHDKDLSIMTSEYSVL